MKRYHSADDFNRATQREVVTAIRRAMTAQGLSQRDVARLMGCDPAHLSRTLRRPSAPGAALFDVAEAVGVSLRLEARAPRAAKRESAS